MSPPYMVEPLQPEGSLRIDIREPQQAGIPAVLRKCAIEIDGERIPSDVTVVVEFKDFRWALFIDGQHYTGAARIYRNGGLLQSIPEWEGKPLDGERWAREQ